MSELIENFEQLKPCPFCGGEVSIALCGDGFDAWWFITRGHGENACKCRLFMESEKFNKDSEMADFVADDLIAEWNRRADAVPVVRCEECSNKEEHSYYCLLHSIFVRSDFFCKDGGCDK